MKKKAFLNLFSSVRTLSIKCYDEQIPCGWEVVVEYIKSISSDEIQILAIRHDKDLKTDDIWKPSLEKCHYHIIIRVLNKKQKCVSTLLKMLGIEFRKGTDDKLWQNHGAEGVRNFSSMAVYLTHETEQALVDGKYVYPLKDIVSNLSLDEIKRIREGYINVSRAGNNKLTMSELAKLDEEAKNLGRELADFDKWFNSFPFNVRSHPKMKTIEKSYYRGVDEKVLEGTEITRLCVFVQGKPGVDKSYAAEFAVKDKQFIKIGGGGTGKFDNVKPWTEVMIIDDDICPNLLNASDNKMVKLYRRNSNNPTWCGKILIVTSNLSFDKWLEQSGIYKQEHIDAMYDRFYICEIKTQNDIKTLYCSSPSKRGNPEQQNERKKCISH